MNFVIYMVENYPEEFTHNNEVNKVIADHYFKRKFLLRNAGKLSEYIPSKSDLSINEMSDFITDVYTFIVDKMKIKINTIEEFLTQKYRIS